MTRLSTFVLTIGLLTAVPAAHAIEEPAYTVERQYDGFEMRAYAPVLVAEVTVAGPAEDAGNQGFRILAGLHLRQEQGRARDRDDGAGDADRRADEDRDDRAGDAGRHRCVATPCSSRCRHRSRCATLPEPLDAPHPAQGDARQALRRDPVFRLLVGRELHRRTWKNSNAPRRPPALRPTANRSTHVTTRRGCPGSCAATRSGCRSGEPGGSSADGRSLRAGN